ncbi:MAG: hypothetical protein DRI86_11235 [Bacteroidetes bacterium]|nr:MAG: hypothetical protein DRI86_11235 [Bacteroidota bacterium]
MKPIQLVIFTESFIINKGLEFIFKKIRGLTVIATVDNEQDLLFINMNKQVNFILTSNTMFDACDSLKNIYKTDNSKSWGLIYTDRTHFEGFYNFDLILSILDSESETIHRIQDYLKRISEPNDDSEQYLSNREKEILKQVALGLTNSQIGEKLFISQHTVVTHRKKITAKLGIKTISGLTVYALLNNLIEISDIDELN